jgi:hypothetical protein
MTLPPRRLPRRPRSRRQVPLYFPPLVPPRASPPREPPAWSPPPTSSSSDPKSVDRAPSSPASSSSLARWRRLLSLVRPRAQKLPLPAAPSQQSRAALSQHQANRAACLPVYSHPPPTSTSVGSLRVVWTPCRLRRLLLRWVRLVPRSGGSGSSGSGGQSCPLAAPILTPPSLQRCPRRHSHQRPQRRRQRCSQHQER